MTPALMSSYRTDLFDQPGRRTRVGQDLVGSHPRNLLHLARLSNLWISSFIVPTKDDVYDVGPIRQGEGVAPNVVDFSAEIVMPVSSNTSRRTVDSRMLSGPSSASTLPPGNASTPEACLTAAPLVIIRNLLPRRTAHCVFTMNLTGLPAVIS